MYYSEMVKKACIISFNAHKNDVDKSGYPYIYHPFFLATQFDDESSVCVALMHDVIEDHGDVYSLKYLQQQGFSDEVLTALKLLTHDINVEYMDYVREIAQNALARRVKMADLLHNSDVSRSNGKLPPKAELYKQAYAYLLKVEQEHQN